MSFPASLHTIYTLVDNTDDVLATHPNTLSAEIRYLEDKVGVDSSSVVTSVDYFLKHASGAFRNHIHDGGSDDGALLDWDSCWSDAVHTHASDAEGGLLPLGSGVTGTLPIINGGTAGTTSSSAFTNIVVPNMATLLAYAYPVGSIYTSTVSTNPNTLFGFGTWSAFGEGRVLVGKASSGTFVTAGSSGGAETHTLTTGELASHTHGITVYQATGGSTGVQGLGATATGSANTNSAGSGSAHNNLQPYIVVYMWQRVS